MSEVDSLLGEVLIEITRSNRIESVHGGHLIALDQSGEINFSLGSYQPLIFPRSAIKAIQTSAMIRSGLKVGSEEVALISASHAGSERHQEIVLKILQSAGLNESALKNTADKPLGIKERRSWGDKKPTPLAANCSGKHAGMLATCVINGWDISSYKEDSHPLQRVIVKELENLSGEKIKEISVDGCGAPLFLISLLGLARSIHNLVNSDDPIHQEVVGACLKHPELVSGEGRVVTESMRSLPGLFMKDGAEGVMVFAIAGKATFAWKMSDGSNRGDKALISAALARVGVELKFDPVNIYGDGQVVGTIRASKLVGDEKSK